MFFGVSGNGERVTGNGLRDGLRGVGEASAGIFSRVEQVERVGLVGGTSCSWRVAGHSLWGCFYLTRNRRTKSSLMTKTRGACLRNERIVERKRVPRGAENQL